MTTANQTETLTKDQKIELSLFRAMEALEQNGNSDTWNKDYFGLKNALADIRDMLQANEK